MMVFLKSIKWIVCTLVIVGLGAFLDYYLPSEAVVQLTGTDVKRMDTRRGRYLDHEGANVERVAPTYTRDIRFINAITADDKVRVYRNEDTGWHWPPYFKFDSADMTARTQSILSSGEKPHVQVTYYGWRIQLLSLFPNMVDMKLVEPGYRPVNWVRIMFFTAMAIAGFFFWRWYRGFRRRVEARLAEQANDAAGPFRRVFGAIRKEWRSWTGPSRG